MNEKDNLPAAAASPQPCQERRRALAHVGGSILTRDLVWCECGRGLSRSGIWIFCPCCGSEIDQDSYATACIDAEINGAQHFSNYDADLLNKLVVTQAALEQAKTDFDTIAYAHSIRADLQTLSTLRDNWQHTFDVAWNGRARVEDAISAVSQGARLRDAAGKGKGAE